MKIIILFALLLGLVNPVTAQGFNKDGKYINLRPYEPLTYAKVKGMKKEIASIVEKMLKAEDGFVDLRGEIYRSKNDRAKCTCKDVNPRPDFWCEVGLYDATLDILVERKVNKDKAGSDEEFDEMVKINDLGYEIAKPVLKKFGYSYDDSKRSFVNDKRSFRVGVLHAFYVKHWRLSLSAYHENELASLDGLPLPPKVDPLKTSTPHQSKERITAMELHEEIYKVDAIIEKITQTDQSFSAYRGEVKEVFNDDAIWDAEYHIRNLPLTKYLVPSLWKFTTAFDRPGYAFDVEIKLTSEEEKNAAFTLLKEPLYGIARAYGFKRTTNESGKQKWEREAEGLSEKITDAIVLTTTDNFYNDKKKILIGFTKYGKKEEQAEEPKATAQLNKKTPKTVAPKKPSSPCNGMELAKSEEHKGQIKAFVKKMVASSETLDEFKGAAISTNGNEKRYACKNLDLPECTSCEVFTEGEEWRVKVIYEFEEDRTPRYVEKIVKSIVFKQTQKEGYTEKHDKLSKQVKQGKKDPEKERKSKEWGKYPYWPESWWNRFQVGIWAPKEVQFVFYRNEYEEEMYVDPDEVLKGKKNVIKNLFDKNKK